MFSIRKFQSNYLIHKLILALILFSKATLKPIRNLPSFDIVILLQKKIIVDTIILLARWNVYQFCLTYNVFHKMFSIPDLKWDVNGSRYRVQLFFSQSGTKMAGHAYRKREGVVTVYEPDIANSIQTTPRKCLLRSPFPVSLVYPCLLRLFQPSA